MSLQALLEENHALIRENKALKLENMLLQEKYDLLTYKRFVRSSEQENTTQQSLFNEGSEETGNKAEKPEKVEPEVREPEVHEHIEYDRRKRAGRKPIPKEIPREVEVIDLPEEVKRCACCA
jgi:hypothetical protein